MQMQRECETNTAVAEEAMQAAASEVSAVTEQLDKETAARESLQGSVRDLELQLVKERQTMKLSSTEWMTNRAKWQRETNTLIASIQQDCNTVFAQNMHHVRTASPRSVLAGDATNDSTSTEIPHDTSNDLSKIESVGGSPAEMTLLAFHQTPWKRVQLRAATSYKSPLDVSHALDETEALVRSLVGN